MKRSARFLLFAFGAILFADGASAQNFAKSSLQESFRFDWAVEQSGRAPVMKGYIYNSNGARAVNVRVLAVELDAAGQSVKQTASWVPSGIPGNGRAYFEVPVGRADAKYRVSLESFDWLQEGKIN